MVTLDKTFVLKLLNKLANVSDQGPKGETWQSDELRAIIRDLANVCQAR